MKTNPNDPSTPMPYVNECGTIQHDVYFGFTKLEHIAIEFTKAIISSRMNKLSDIDSELMSNYCFKGIRIADELIKQLNKDEK